MVEQSDRFQDSQRILLSVLWLELLTLTIKLLVGYQSKSLALLASALYCAIAATSAVYAITSTQNLKQCGRVIWGHSRWEAIIAFGLAGLLGFGVFGLSGAALQQLVMLPDIHQAMPIVVSDASLKPLLLFGLVSFGLAWVILRAAKRHGILALLMTGEQVFREAVVSLGLLLALVAIRQGYAWLDPLFTLGLCFGAVLAGWRMMTRQMPLMVRQMAIAPESIAQVVKQIDGITHCDQIESRGIVGRQVLIDLRVTVHPEFLGMEGHLMQSVEAVLRQSYGPVKVKVKIDSDWHSLQDALALTGSGQPSQVDRF
jgi:divalent metal cation (Fe/Co/Zn/Cd) transporter